MVKQPPQTSSDISGPTGNKAEILLKKLNRQLHDCNFRVYSIMSTVFASDKGEKKALCFMLHICIVYLMGWRR